jgi:hypothetical protein
VERRIVDDHTVFFGAFTGWMRLFQEGAKTMQRLQKSLHDIGEIDHPVISDGLRQVPKDLQKKPNQIHRRDRRIAIQGALRQEKLTLRDS